ncbi:TraR/DksA family transcriptional regulator [Candidatus Poriferisocius sp.]|uniref:TraR/DksA family transcriptional regulator n=1 Tax=Candidatus Poriferisocius sp. TaxID=3101276 RepID=UPI003B011517
MAAKKTAPKTSAKSKAGGSKPAAKKPAAKKPAAKKPAAKKPLFDKKYLDKQRRLLLEERSRYIDSATRLKAEADSLVEEREPGDVQFDEESGEGDTLAVERERDLALSAHARAAVDQIDAALARIDDGTYGICLVSGKPIPRQRLNAIPWAAERVEHKAGGF